MSGEPVAQSHVPAGAKSHVPAGASWLHPGRPLAGLLQCRFPEEVRLVKVVRPRLRLPALHLDQPRWSGASSAAANLIEAWGGGMTGWERQWEQRHSPDDWHRGVPV